MKRRISLAIIIYTTIILAEVLALVFLDSNSRGTSIFLTIALSLLNTIYLFFGFSVFACYSIYFLLIGLGILLFRNMIILVAVVGAVIIVVNPLSFFSKYLNKKLPKISKGILQIDSLFFTKRREYYRYRKAMKEHFHIPQFLKIKNRKTYKLVHMASVFALFFLAVFLLVWDLPRIAYNNITPMSIFRIYSGFALFVLDFVLFKKGFSSLLSFFSILVFPSFVIITIILYENIGSNVFIILESVIIATMIINVVYQIKYYYMRITYVALNYVDKKSTHEVCANALFETFIYSKYYNYIAKYNFKANKDLFNQKLQKILEYLNYHKIILMSYLYDKDEVSLYFLFYNKDTKANTKFKAYLMNLLGTEIFEYSFEDKAFNVFEVFFMQRNEFIISYAKHLAKLSRVLTNSKSIVISLTFYFTKYEKMISFFNAQKSVRIKNIESYQTFVLNTNIECDNNDFLIENNLMDTIILATINEAKFIKLNIYNIN
jgi:hypothetical protein